mmetsp:Transcript_20288/g.49737  ORF Transcript_20288/g.49737 Transcript_20288/m.49737 type:complete len:218 (-) Transcript_20288:271-924(-)
MFHYWKFSSPCLLELHGKSYTMSFRTELKVGVISRLYGVPIKSGAASLITTCTIRILQNGCRGGGECRGTRQRHPAEYKRNSNSTLKPRERNSTMTNSTTKTTTTHACWYTQHLRSTWIPSLSNCTRKTLPKYSTKWVDETGMSTSRHLRALATESGRATGICIGHTCRMIPPNTTVKHANMPFAVVVRIPMRQQQQKASPYPGQAPNRILPRVLSE